MREFLLPSQRLRNAGVLILMGAAAFLSSGVFASEQDSGQKHPKEIDWSFTGPMGTIDKQQAQRGLQVFREVCASCHSIHRVAFRSLKDLGFTEAEVKALAAEYTIQDGPNDEGEMFDRPGRPSDKFPLVYPNEQAARAANNGAWPPDLSLIMKARHDGPNYVHSLITGYNEDMPATLHLSPGLTYNPYFPSLQIAMPAPITSAGQVQYADGTEASVDQMTKDVVTFLEWAAEPEQDTRKRMGAKVVLFLLVTCVFFYFAKRKIWSDLH